MCSTFEEYASSREKNAQPNINKMSSKENNEVAVEKIENDKAGSDAKCDLKGTKRAAEVCGLC